MVHVNGNTAEFSFFRPRAGQVTLVGGFGGADSRLPMSRTPGGYWRATIHLPAGEYRFHYLADGARFADFAAFGIEYGQSGPDSIVRVGANAAFSLSA